METTNSPEATIVTDLEVAHAQTCELDGPHSAWDCPDESETIDGTTVVYSDSHGYRTRTGETING